MYGHVQKIGCNIVLLILGLAAAGLAGSQFSSVQIYNYRNIDLRLLNWIHALTGAIGLYAVAANHGAVAAKTLYCVSFVIGFATAADRSRSAQDYNKTLTSVALIKLVFGVGALGLAVFIEYEHEKVDDTDKYIKIALEHIAAMLAIMSSIIDIMASRERRIEQINLLVKI
ncbi:hypothetical protein ANCCEY_05292 [Ancylostoma ceylanicum]|uniref:Uncharacterized protein n=1 Tax=Ancylostoma ceylanicum TaxID=53326 RepID=A0A0D6LWM9_9BILA|nr:hypothetical protein ANCCEY_05292 [Ancylostoma ceylanicum]